MTTPEDPLRLLRDALWSLFMAPRRYIQGEVTLSAKTFDDALEPIYHMPPLAAPPVAGAEDIEHNHPDDSLCLASECPLGAWRAALRSTAPALDEPDFLDGARAEYRECMEVRRLLGYLWTATGDGAERRRADPSPLLLAPRDLFADDDPIVADIERLAIFPAALEGAQGGD